MFEEELAEFFFSFPVGLVVSATVVGSVVSVAASVSSISSALSAVEIELESVLFAGSDVSELPQAESAMLEQSINADIAII